VLLPTFGDGGRPPASQGQRPWRRARPRRRTVEGTGGGHRGAGGLSRRAAPNEEREEVVEVKTLHSVASGSPDNPFLRTSLLV
jgi:hypothetical protein